MWNETQEGPRVVAVPLASLRPAEWSARSISEERLVNLSRSLQEDPDFLWKRPVLAQTDGTVYAGVARLRAAQALGLSVIPVILEDVSDEVARARSIRDNSHWADWDDDQLATMLGHLAAEGLDLDFLGPTERELQQLLDRL